MGTEICGQEYKHKKGKSRGVFESRLVHRALGDKIKDLRQRRDEVLVAQLANGKGARLKKQQIVARASLEREYKNKRVWVRRKTGKDREVGEFFCLGFDGQDMHARCVARDNELHTFDPDKFEFESRSERTLRFAQQNIERMERKLDGLKKTVASLEEEKARLQRMVYRTENEMRRERKRYDLSRFLKKEEGE